MRTLIFEKCITNEQKAQYFISRNPSAEILYDADFNSRWHPKLGSEIVCLDENKSDGYDTCEQAIEAARLFKEHCKIYLV